MQVPIDDFTKNIGEKITGTSNEDSRSRVAAYSYYTNFEDVPGYDFRSTQEFGHFSEFTEFTFKRIAHSDVKAIAKQIGNYLGVAQQLQKNCLINFQLL